AAFGGCGCRIRCSTQTTDTLLLVAQFRDCVTNAQAIACARHTDILQQLVVNLPKQINIKIVGLEGIGVLSEADGIQPFADLTHVASCSKSALASFRSSVSWPSVNQP